MKDETSLVVFEDDPEVVQEMRRRQEEAEELEKKLKVIQETVPTRIFNVCGSSAGAGSGDFHQYRMIRRREQDRLKRIEEEAVEAGESERKQKRFAFLKKMDEMKTERNRQKRQKAKLKKKAKRARSSETVCPEPQMEGEVPTGVEGEKRETVIPEQVELD